MSVEELVKRLRGVDHMSVEDCFLQSPLFGHAADKLEELAAEVERCHARLEIDRHYVPNEAGDGLVEVSIPLHEREKFPDGIEARDATIKGQDEQLFALRKWRLEYVGKLTIAEAALAEKDKEIAALRAERDALAAEVERVRDGNRYAHLEQIAIKRANKAEAALAERDKEIAALRKKANDWSMEADKYKRALDRCQARNAGGKDA